MGIRLLRLYLLQVFFCCFVHGFRDLGQSSAAILFSLLLSLAVKTRPSLQIRPTSSQRERDTDIYEWYFIALVFGNKIAKRMAWQVGGVTSDFYLPAMKWWAKKGFEQIRDPFFSPPSFVKAIVVGMRRNHVWLEVFNGARRDTRKKQSVVRSWSTFPGTTSHVWIYLPHTHMPRPYPITAHGKKNHLRLFYSTFCIYKSFSRSPPPLKRKNNYNLFRRNLPGSSNNTHPAEIQS